MPQGQFPGPPLSSHVIPHTTSFGISGRFQPLSPGIRQVIHVLLTLPPLSCSCPQLRSTCMPHPHCQRSIWTKIKFSRNNSLKTWLIILYINLLKKFRAASRPFPIKKPRTSSKFYLYIVYLLLSKQCITSCVIFLTLRCFSTSFALVINTIHEPMIYSQASFWKKLKYGFIDMFEGDFLFWRNRSLCI